MPQKQRIIAAERLKMKLCDPEMAISTPWTRESANEQDWRSKLLLLLLVQRGQSKPLMTQLETWFGWLSTNAQLPLASIDELLNYDAALIQEWLSTKPQLPPTSIKELLDYDAALLQSLPTPETPIPFTKQHMRNKAFVQETLLHFTRSRWHQYIKDKLREHRAKLQHMPGVLRVMLFASRQDEVRGTIALLTLETKIARVIFDETAPSEQSTRKLFWLVVHAYASLCPEFDASDVSQWDTQWCLEAVDKHLKCKRVKAVRTAVLTLSERCMGYTTVRMGAERRLVAVTLALAAMQRSVQNPLIGEIVAGTIAAVAKDARLLELREGVPVKRDASGSLVIRLPRKEQLYFEQIDAAERFLVMADFLEENPYAPPLTGDPLHGGGRALSPMPAILAPLPPNQPVGARRSPMPAAAQQPSIDNMMDRVRTPFVSNNIRRENANSLLARFMAEVELEHPTFELGRSTTPPSHAAELDQTVIEDVLRHIQLETNELERSASELTAQITEDMLQHIQLETNDLEHSAGELAQKIAYDIRAFQAAQKRRAVQTQVKQIRVMVRVVIAQMLPFSISMLTQRALAERMRINREAAALIKLLSRVSEEVRIVTAETMEVPRMQAEYDLRQMFLSSARLFLPAVVFEDQGCAGCNTPLDWESDGGIGFVPDGGLACDRCVPILCGRFAGAAKKPEFEVVKTVKSIRKALAASGCPTPIEYPFNGKTMKEMKDAFCTGGGLFLPSAMYDKEMSCNLCLGTIEWDDAPRRPGFALCCPGLGFICGTCVSQPHGRCGHELSVEFEIARMVGEVRNEVGI